MAALKLTVDSLDGIDDAIKPLYVEDGGKFKLSVEGIEDTTALKGALQKERKAREDRDKQAKVWERIGKTPDEISELLEAQQQREQTEAERKGEWDKLRAQMNDKHQTELKNKDETIGQMRKRLEAELVDAKAVSAIASADGNPRLLLNVVKGFVKVDDGFNVVVVDSKGDPRVNAKGEPLSISDLITELRSDSDYGQAFKGSGQSGGGTQPGHSNGGMPKPPHNRRSEFSRAERIAYVESFGGGAPGSAAWNALPP